MKFKVSIKNIPNILTIVRILMVPAIVVLLLVPSNIVLYSLKTSISGDNVIGEVTLNFLLAGVLFLIASITDFIDGYISRKYNAISDFGKLMDPIADKILINSTLICFASLNIIPIWIVIIMLARDIFVDGARMMSASKKIVVPANYWGKLKTVVQIFAIIFIFFFFNMPLEKSLEWFYWGVQNLLIFIATFVSVLSGFIYLYEMYFLVNKKENKTK